MGHESDPEYQTVKTEQPKNVMVIGAGPAECRRPLRRPSADITSRSMTGDRWAGGQYRIASIPPERGEIASFLCWQVNELKKLNVPVILNTTVTREMVLAEKPDVVIAATGVTPIVPKKIPGVENANVVLGQDVLTGAANTGDLLCGCRRRPGGRRGCQSPGVPPQGCDGG